MKIKRSYLKQIILEELQKEMQASEFYKPWESPMAIPDPQSSDSCTPKDIILKARTEMNTEELDMLVNRLSMILRNRTVGSLEEGCGCQEDHGEILVAYDATGKEVMRSNAFKEGSEEALQLQKLVPVLQAQDLQVEIIPAPHDHPMAVSVDDAPEEKIH